MQNSRNVESRKLFIYRKNRVELNLTHNHQELNDILDATRIQCETVSVRSHVQLTCRGHIGPETCVRYVRTIEGNVERIRGTPVPAFGCARTASFA